MDSICYSCPLIPNRTSHISISSVSSFHRTGCIANEIILLHRWYQILSFFTTSPLPGMITATCRRFLAGVHCRWYRNPLERLGVPGGSCHQGEGRDWWRCRSTRRSSWNQQRHDYRLTPRSLHRRSLFGYSESILLPLSCCSLIGEWLFCGSVIWQGLGWRHYLHEFGQVPGGLLALRPYLTAGCRLWLR